jgi:penicillin-insensitive murein endopeptidase
VAPPEVQMVHYDSKGRPFVPKHMKKNGYRQPDWKKRRFDVKRNWALVEALVTDPDIRVQWVFVSRELKRLMVRHAEKAKRPSWVIEYARRVMSQPGRSAPHDDHFHVRIYCPRGDRALGCQDTGPVWHHEKKTYKYAGPERYDPALWRTVFALPLFLPIG